MNPFYYIPWQADFLAHLGECITTDGEPGQAVVIFMHNRPKRYLRQVFQKQAQAAILPQMLTVEELQQQLGQHFGLSGKLASELSQVALLEICVQQIPELKVLPLASLERGDFFSWGIHLAKLLEECLTQGVEPQDLSYVEGEVLPFGEDLLGALGQIFQAYVQLLAEKNLTTKGLWAYQLSQALGLHSNLKFSSVSNGAGLANGSDVPDLPEFLQFKNIYVAVSGTFTATEEKMFHWLWQKGAKIVLPIDPELEHWSGRHLRELQGRWQAQGELRELTTISNPTLNPRANINPALTTIQTTTPELKFFSGYDLHSQLDCLRRDLAQTRVQPDSNGIVGESISDSIGSNLAEAKATEVDLNAGGAAVSEFSNSDQVSRAIILPNSAALLPVLHHIPVTDCNISLGYSLEGSLLFTLLQSILQLRSSARGNEYYHADILNVIRHPYWRWLPGLSVQLADLELHLRTGRAWVSCTKQSALDSLWAVLDFSTVETLEQLANALARVCDFLFEAGEEEWEKHPLDSEAMFRLVHRIIPELKNNELSLKTLPWLLLQEICLQLLRAEHVPFEADPLTGLQVLGMLETRLLHFDEVYLLEATDDYLPGRSSQNPLLPDSLREVIGLPDVHEREQLAAFTFYRLLAGAKLVHIYWQEGVEAQGLFEAKKQRSRLVEELIWQQEKKSGQRWYPGFGSWRVANPQMQPSLRVRQAVEKKLALTQVQQFLQKPISASSLDIYLSCPLKFYYQILCKLQPLAEVKEDDDPARVGELLHQVLHQYYEPLQGQWLAAAEAWDEAQKSAELGKLQEIFTACLAESELLETLPPESATMLKVSGLARLSRLLSSEPRRQLVQLETRLQHSFAGFKQNFTLLGKLDRLDLRAEGLLVLDYKTGKISPMKKGFWQKDIWADLNCASYDYAEEPNLLPELSKIIPSVQLPLYAYLVSEASEINEQYPLYEACYLSLAEDGKPYPLFGDLSLDQKKMALQEQIPQLFRYILGHLAEYPSFDPQEGRHCDWCAYANLCLG